VLEIAEIWTLRHHAIRGHTKSVDFQDRCLKPLGHPSNSAISITYRYILSERSGNFGPLGRARRCAGTDAAPAGRSAGPDKWHYVAAQLDKAAAGADTADVAIVLRIVLSIEGVECRSQ
jgi:hypothetical protein